jgi:predicted glutamine amidotransferase
MSGGRERVAATFWLLDAPDSLAIQSHREPDGTGLGTFAEDGRPRVDKQALAAYEDRAFAREAREVRSRTFVAHIRFASTGAVAPENTHPFEQRGRLFAHNGVVTELPRLEARLGGARSLVRGETDSERVFALISSEIERLGEPGAAIAAAVAWIADELPVYALNLILISDSELWALRYPDVHGLYVLERQAGGSAGGRELHHRGAHGGVGVDSAHLASRPAVVIASEPMDAEPGWRSLASGELLHVDADLRLTSTQAVDRAPRRQLTLADLEPRAASSQAPTGRRGASPG